MIKFFRKKIGLIFLVILFPFGVTLAAQDDGVYTYVFHLYFDQDALVQDHDFDFPFELITGEWQGFGKTDGVYYGEILSVSNQPLASFAVIPPVSGKGKLSPQAPYFANARTAYFYNPQGKKLLTIDLAPSGPVCNEDKVCNNDTGETYLNCTSDCSPPVSPSVSPGPSPAFSITDLLSSTIFWLILTIILVIVLVLILIRRKKTNPPAETPPQV